jgi:hypothetical protein
MIDSHTPAPFRHSLAEAMNVLFVGVLVWWAVTLAPPERPVPALAPAVVPPCVMDRDGFVRGELFGSIERRLDWSGAGMLCDGMPRPDGAGIRLVFSETASAPAAGLRLVIGIAGIAPGAAPDAPELVANVTLIDQDRGVFYSTQGLERCWVRPATQNRLANSAPEAWRLDGKLFCVGALAAVEGPDSVTLGDIDFSGRIRFAPDAVE